MLGFATQFAGMGHVYPQSNEQTATSHKRLQTWRKFKHCIHVIFVLGEAWWCI